MRIAIYLLGAAAFLFDPLSACIGEPMYTFGEREMRAAVEGTWELSVQPPQGDPQRFTLQIAQSSKPEHAARAWIKTAAACGHRSFVRNASACLDVTRMPLEIHVAQGAHVEDTTGELLVVGTKFEKGTVTVQLDQQMLEAQITPAGAVLSASASGGDTMKVALKRKPRG